MEITNVSDISLKQKNDLCRVCLSSNEKNKCIFTFNVSLERQSSTGLLEELKFYGGIEIKPNDGLPSKICEKCICNLRVAHDFRTRCRETDEKLRSLNENIEKISDGDSTGGSKDIREKEFERDDRLVERNESRGASVESFINEKSICPEKSRTEIDLATRDQRRSLGRPTIPEKLSSERLGAAWKMRTERSKVPVANENSKNILRKREISMTKIPRACDENSISNGDKNRSKRSTIHGRATSMENLKNRKERQRRYVKKKLFPPKNDKISRIENDPSAPRVRTDLTLSRRRRRRESYASENASDERPLGRDAEEFSCQRCDERFARLAEFLKHARSHRSEETDGPAVCRICDKNFRKARPTMVRHLNAHKRQNPRAVYEILKEMRDARQKDKSTVGQSSRKKKIPRNENFAKSKRSNPRRSSKLSYDENEGEFFSREIAADLASMEIPSDEESTIKLINAWIREELNYENEDKDFACDICEKSYATKRSLLGHKARSHEESSRCDSRSLLDEFREKIVEEREKMKLNRCEDRDEGFENATRLESGTESRKRVKRREDKNFKRFLCHICSKTFRQNAGLNFHLRIHTGYKPHVCKYCQRSFTSSSNCINHERTHTGDRPYVCHFCSAAFAKSCTLKAHITTHTGEANYHCKTCGKSFRRLKYLKEHRFTHTGEKPYVCKLCGTGYGHSGSLFVHEKKCKVQHGAADPRAVTENFPDSRIVIMHNGNRTIDPPILPIKCDEIYGSAREEKIFYDQSQGTNRSNDDARSSEASDARNWEYK